MAGPTRRLVVGLGNPGEEYRETRHNVGFRIVERLVADHRLPAFYRRGASRETQGDVGGVRVSILEPLAYMNLSGGQVAKRLRDLELGPSDLLVCYDELALPLGRLRLRAEGSAGGHNGVQSVIDALDTEAFPRLRFGVRPDGRFSDQVRFVLSPFRPAERELVEETLPRAARAAACFCTEGIVQAMNLFNAGAPSSTPNE